MAGKSQMGCAPHILQILPSKPIPYYFLSSAAQRESVRETDLIYGESIESSDGKVESKIIQVRGET